MTVYLGIIPYTDSFPGNIWPVDYSSLSFFSFFFIFFCTEPHVSQSGLQFALMLAEDDLVFQTTLPLPSGAGSMHARQVLSQWSCYTLPALHLCLVLFIFKFRL